MIKQNGTYKLAMIGDSLANGGAEKVHALLSIYFSSKGIDVHNCILGDKVSYEFGGSLLNLGKLNSSSFSPKRKLSRFLALRKFIHDGQFDYLIDFRMRTGFLQELLISSIYPKNSIYTIHSSILDYYFPKPEFLAKRLYKNIKLIAVSEHVKDAMLSAKLANDVDFIYNPIDLPSVIRQAYEYEIPDINFILAVGRMNVDIKQFDKLITAYSQSTLPQKNIKLLIIGEGEYLPIYQKHAENLGVGNLVQFKGFVENPFPYYKKAMFVVMSSRNEGMPMVLLEALASGTPVVSFDCQSGPREIISNFENGLLVDDQNVEKLSQAMDLFTSDSDLYLHCKSNAKQSIEKFALPIIGKQWLDLLRFNVS